MNDWDDRTRFRQKPGKYAMIHVESADSASINKEIERINKRNADLKVKMIQVESQ